VTLLAVNSYLVHAYWDVDPAALPAPNPLATLRFHDLAQGSPQGSFDVAVDLDARNWYVHLWSPAQAYYAELGWNEEGEFHSLAKSNPVETPRAWPVSAEEPQLPRSPATLPPVKNTADDASATVALALEPSHIPETAETRPQREAEVQHQPEAQPPKDAAEALQRRLEDVYAAHGVSPSSIAALEPPLPDAPVFEAPIERLEDTAEPHAKHTVDAAGTLRRRLDEIRALQGESAQAVEAAQKVAGQPQVPVQPQASGDLTGQAEARFSCGVSSFHANSCPGESKR